MSATTAPTGTRRLAPGARRAQLLAAGLDLVERHPLESVGAAEVAAHAGVSKALVFHYFATTDDLHAAIFEAAAAELLASLPTDPGLPAEERLRAGLETYVASIERRPAAHLAVVRSLGSNPQLAAVVERSRARVVALIIDALQLDTVPPALRMMVRAWIAMVEDAVLHWLQARPVARVQLVDLLQQLGLATLAAAAGQAAGDD